jgi:hypothetical protein
MKMGGPAWVVPGNYAKANMLLQVDKIKTPLLVMHGENDPQVPPANAAMLVKAMKEHHKTVFYFTYPNELHWVSTTPHKIDSWEKELAFLDHYINPKIGMTSTSLDVAEGDGRNRLYSAQHGLSSVLLRCGVDVHHQSPAACQRVGRTGLRPHP